MNAAETPVSCQRGMTLIELMIAMLIGLIVIGGVLGIFVANSETNRRTGDLARIQENARAAVQFMAHSIREAGGNPCGLPADKGLIKHAATAPASTWWTGGADFKSTLVGYKSGTGFPATGGIALVTGSDAVITVSAVASVTPVIKDNPPNNPMEVPPTHGFKQNDALFACSETKGYGVVFKAGAVSSKTGAAAIERVSKFPENTENMIVSTLGRIAAEGWFVGNNTRGGKSLFRAYYEGGTTGAGIKVEELVPDISAMNISYLLPGADQYESTIKAEDWPRVTAAYIELTIARQIGKTSQAITRTVGLTVKLRNRSSTP